jgi:hypothetical protein
MRGRLGGFSENLGEVVHHDVDAGSSHRMGPVDIERPGQLEAPAVSLIKTCPEGDGVPVDGHRLSVLDFECGGDDHYLFLDHSCPGENLIEGGRRNATVENFGSATKLGARSELSHEIVSVVAESVDAQPIRVLTATCVAAVVEVSADSIGEFG